MPDRPDDVVRRFAEACRSGDIAAVSAVLDTGAIAVCDGGGTVPAAMSPVRGAADVAQLVTALLRGPPGAELTIEAVNGRSGLALRRADRAVAVAAVTVTGAKIAILWIVLNPAKLHAWHRR